MKRTSIDIGSNSVLLLCAEWNGKIENELLNFSHITSLGKDLDKTKVFHAESMDATFKALLDYKEKLSQISVAPDEVIVTATEASRVATNAKEFYARIKHELGFDVHIISSDEEAYFTALGVVSGVTAIEKKLVVMDIGGASTELILINSNPFKIMKSISLPVGSVRATDWMKEQIFDSKMHELLDLDLSDYLTTNLICVAGSMTSLATMYLGKTEFNDQAIDGLKINVQDFQKFKDNISKLPTSEILATYPFLGKRAPMVSAGAEVACQILNKLKVKNIQVSTRGLRYGVVFQGSL